MIKRITLFALLFPVLVHAQKGITFEIEKLKAPEKLLPRVASKDIYQKMIIQDAGLTPFDIKKNGSDFKFNIVAQSKGPDSVINYEGHSFFSGMYQAYADHRPFVLSPDMIWLLIQQGFARHVNNNAEELRDYFVKHDGKATLIVNNNKISLDDPQSPWEEVFPEFSKQISAHAGAELTKNLTADFSTTTPTVKAVSEITIMETVKPYFEFVVIYISCGIPKVTLEGTPKDWQNVLNKARLLKKYKLEWWIDELEPMLQEFVNTSKGKVNKDFWRNMFKYHTAETYGAPKIIDGWIVKFFPYNKQGGRNSLKELNSASTLPSELVKVDFLHTEVNGTATISTPMELWAGFTGLDQDSKTFALRPRMGWMIRKKDTLIKELSEKLARGNYSEEGISIRVNKVPKELLSLPYIKTLRIQFIGDIVIPDEMAKVKIDRMILKGKISEEESKRLTALFPHTEIIINGPKMNVVPY